MEKKMEKKIEAKKMTITEKALYQADMLSSWGKELPSYWFETVTLATHPLALFDPIPMQHRRHLLPEEDTLYMAYEDDNGSLVIVYEKTAVPLNARLVTIGEFHGRT